MTANNTTAIVDHKLSASESEVEAWKTDHLQAMRVFDCQGLVATIVEHYHEIDRLNRSIVDDIVEGRIDYNETTEGLIKDFYARWRTLAVEVRDCLSIRFVKQEDFTLDKEDELAKCIEMAQDLQLRNFDDYANKLASEMTIPLELVDKFQTPLHMWPE